MEPPDNGQCYCYAIMSSLCFQCQVKIHLLHLTASPHGELKKCPTTETGTHSSQTRTDPKGRSQTPQSAGKDLSQSLNSPTRINYAKPDCDKCYYYMNFINKLTSGLCEENIMRMVCSNPCLISSDHPATDADGPSKPGPDVQFPRVTDNRYSNNANNKPSSIRVKSNTSRGTKDKQHPVQQAMKETTTMVFMNSQATGADNSQQKRKMSPDEKPTMPANLMTTDKMLRKSFESICKNRPSPNSSRSPSPRNKLQEIKQTAVKVDHNVPKSNYTSKNVSKPANNNVRVPAQQSNSLKSTQKKSPKSEPTMQRQMASKEQRFPNSDGRRSLASGKLKQTENSKIGTVLQNSRAAGKMTVKPPDPAPGGSTNGGEAHHTTHATEEGSLKTAKYEEQPPEAMEIGVKTVDRNTPMDGFFEAALVTEFYQPPQLGLQNTDTDLKQQPVENDISNKTEYCNKSNLSEQESSNKKQTTQEYSYVQYTIPEEFLEEPSLVCDGITSKNRVPVESKSSNSSTKKEMAEDKPRKKSRTSDSKRHDLSWKGTSQAPISAQVKNHILGPEALHKNNDEPPHDTPVRDNFPIGRDLYEYEPYFEQACSDDAGYRVERERYPTYVGTRRDIRDECSQGESPTTATTDIHNVRKASESRHNSMHNNIKKVDKRRYVYECPAGATYMTDGMGGVNSTKSDEDDNKKWKNFGVREAHEITQGAPHGVESTPNSYHRRKKDRQTPKTNDIGKDQIDHTEQIGERRASCEENTNERRGRLSEEEPGAAPVDVGVVKKIREEIESQYTQKLADKYKYNPETPLSHKRAVDKTPNPSRVARASPKDDRSSRPSSPIQKKSRSFNQRHSSTPCTSIDDVTKVYPQFSEYMNPDAERYRSKSAGNIAECHSTPDLDAIPPVKSRSERSSSKWSRGVCSNDKRVYYHTDSNGQCTSMVIGLPQDGGGSNPHIRINFNKPINQEVTCWKVDKCAQKNDYRDTGTQCENDIAEMNSPVGSRPATARHSNNRIPPKPTNKQLQASEQTSSTKPAQTSGHQQMYYNRPLMRRSFQ